MPTAGNDTIVGTPGSDWIDGQAGDDSINGQGGNDTLFGNTGNDTLQGDAGGDFLYGGTGNDSLRGGAGNDYLTGNSGDNIIYGDEGDDTIVLEESGVTQVFGGSGSDTFIIGWFSGSQTSISNIGDFDFNFDVLSFPFTSYAINLGLTLDAVGSGNDIRLVIGPHTVNLLNPVLPALRFGSAGADNMIGSLLDDTLNGLGGNDTLNGGAGGDLLIGGDGDDQLVDSNNIFEGASSDTLQGGDGNDQLIDGRGNDLLEGGSGDDTINLDQGNDFVVTGSGRDLINSVMFGSDTIADFDYINDILDVSISGLRGFTGIDLDGDGASDDALISFIGGNTSNLVLLNFSNPAWRGGAGADTRLGLPFDEAMYGDGGNDFLFGRGGNDSIFGEAGADFINGGEGNDLVDGGAGDDSLQASDQDTLIGGDGNDTLMFGTAGPNRMTGGAGADLFITATGFPQSIGDHVITDFNFAEDRFDFDEVGSIQFGLDLDGDLRSDDAKVIYNNELISLLNAADPGRVVRTGTSAGERIFGSIVDDAVSAGAGNDSVSGGSGNDVLSGDDGADSLWGGSGSDTINGGLGDDTLSGGDGNDVINDGAGNDFIQEFSGADTILLNEGNDTIRADNGIWRLTIHGFNTSEDQLVASPGTRTFMGMLDLDGDGATDDLRMIYSGGATIDLMSIQMSTIFMAPNTPFLSGNPFNDTIVGTSRGESVNGMEGDDIIYGGGGIDNLSGFEGNDTLYGQADADQLSGDFGDDFLSGGDGSDILFTSIGNDTLIGDSGDDWIRQSFINAGGISDLDLLLGGDGNDTIEAGVAWEYIDAGPGDDRVFASGVISAVGLDALHGGVGNDTLFLDGFGSASLTVNLAWGVMQLSGGQSGSLSGFETIRFGFANDVVVGWSGNPVLDLAGGNDWFADYSPAGAASNDTVLGGSGNDGLYGLAGDDSLNGGDGDDFVIGGDGADTLEGGMGADWMAGGAGADVFVFRSSQFFWEPPSPTFGFDVVAQFQPGVDKIDLRGLDGNTNLVGLQPLTIGAFQVGQAGRLRWSSPAGQTYTVVEADLNGDAVRDFVFIVYGETNGQISQVQLTAADFIL
jgi:Ca2+-binding RTX toxin-like protein